MAEACDVPGAVPEAWTASGRVGLVLAALAMAYIVRGCVIFAHNYYRLRAFPGPLPLPMVGNVLDPLLMKSFIQYIKRNREAYGRMWTLWPGNKGVVVCMDPQNARQLLSDAKHTKKPQSYSDTFGIVFGKGLVTSNGEQHKNDRACLGRFFIKGNLEPLIPLYHECAQAGIDTFIKPTVGEVNNVVHCFHMTTLRVATRMIMSWDIWEDMSIAEGIASFVSHGSTTVGEIMAFGLPVWTIFPKVKRLFAEIDYYRDMGVAKTHARRRLLEVEGAEVPDDPLTAMIRAGMDDLLIRDQLMSLVSAGHDTTSFFLAYLCMSLAQHQDIQDKVKAELAAVLGDREEATREDLDQLVYLQQVMQETARLYPVIPFLYREVTEDLLLKGTGHVVPAGTDVLVPLSHVNRDKEIWENPSTFDPDRMAGVTFTSPKHGFFPFAYGTRICIGNALAILESKVILAKLLRQYRVQPDPDFKLKILAGISLVAENVNVIFEEETRTS